eukprot:1408098-Rhodomonas_salina.1
MEGLSERGATRVGAPAQQREPTHGASESACSAEKETALRSALADGGVSEKESLLQVCRLHAGLQLACQTLLPAARDPALQNLDPLRPHRLLALQLHRVPLHRLLLLLQPRPHLVNLRPAVPAEPPHLR